MTHHGFLATLATLAILPVLCETASLARTEADDAMVRTWTDSTGKHSLDAKFLELVDGDVRLERVNGRITRIRLERLSQEDQRYVATRMAEPEPEPEPEPMEPKPSEPDANQEMRDVEAEPLEDFTNSIGMQLKRIPAGEFMMGSPEDEQDLLRDGTQHPVRITKPFCLGAYEVTVGQFRQFVENTSYETEAERDGEGGWGYNEKEKKFEGRKPEYTWQNPGWRQTDDHPVVNVSFNDAVAFCRWLSKKEGKTYRLPTEAEWEHACRAGTTTGYHNGADPEELVRVGNVADADAGAKLDVLTWAVSSRDRFVFTAPVGRFQSNAWGLCDMHGNVWEWCSDWYDSHYYQNSPTEDPMGPTSGALRVFRGGSWNSVPRHCRSANRNGLRPSSRGSSLGFRVAQAPAE